MAANGEQAASETSKRLADEVRTTSSSRIYTYKVNVCHCICYLKISCSLDNITKYHILSKIIS